LWQTATAVFYFVTTSTNVQKPDPRFTILRIKMTFPPSPPPKKISARTALLQQREKLQGSGGFVHNRNSSKCLCVCRAAVTVKESGGVQEDDREPAGKHTAGTASQDHVLKETHLAVFQNCCSVQGPPTV